MQIAQAAKHIQSNEQNPTVDRVLAHLGTGSKSTIAPLLKEWKQKQRELNDSNTEGLPPELVLAIKSLYQQTHNRADERIDTEKRKATEIVERIQKEAENQKSVIETLKEQYGSAKASLTEAIQDNEELKRDKAKLNALNIELTTEKKALVEQIIDLRNSLKDQKMEVSKARNQLDHYQNTMAEERKREREQYQSQIDYLKQSNQQMAMQKDDLSSQLKDVRAINSEHQENTAAINIKHHELKEKYQSLEGELARIKPQLEQVNQKAEGLEQKSNTIETELASTEKDKLVLQAQLEFLESSRAKYESKADILTMKNFDLNQENTALHKQLKELQAAIA